MLKKARKRRKSDTFQLLQPTTHLFLRKSDISITYGSTAGLFTGL